MNIKDLNFNKKIPDDLFGIYEKKEFHESGWGIFSSLKINNVVLKNTLVIVCHSSDSLNKLNKDLEIGFWPDDDEDLEIITTLSKFLDVRITEIIPALTANNITNIVLCVCNPEEKILLMPKSLPKNINWFFPIGNVYMYKEFSSGIANYVLEADSCWITLKT